MDFPTCITKIFNYRAISFLSQEPYLSFSEDEKKRVSNLKNITAQLKFVKRHLALYEMLKNLGMSNQKLHYEKSGQPFLKDISSNTLSYNVSLSSSEDFFVCSISKSFKVGVDIQYISNIQLNNSLIKLVLHPIEETIFINLRHNEKRLFFFEIWAKKESYTKALGTGLVKEFSHINIIDRHQNSEIKSWRRNNYVFSWCLLNC